MAGRKQSVLSWRATVMGALVLELIPETLVLGSAVILTKWMSVLHMPWHAAAVLSVGLGGIFISVFARMNRSLYQAATRPRLRALGISLDEETSFEVIEVADHAEVALGLARDFRRRGQHALARQMVEGVEELVQSVLTMDRSRARIAMLPGDQNEAAVERCVSAIKQVDEALIGFSIQLAEAGGAEEWNAARVDDALGRAANARAISHAMNEVARCA